MTLKDRVKTILEHSVGEKNALTQHTIAHYLKEDPRAIRLAIRELIKEGMPIASGNYGYFIVSSHEEARIYQERVKSMLIEDAKRIRDFKRAAGNYLAPAKQERLL